MAASNVAADGIRYHYLVRDENGRVVEEGFSRFQPHLTSAANPIVARRASGTMSEDASTVVGSETTDIYDRISEAVTLANESIAHAAQEPQVLAATTLLLRLRSRNIHLLHIPPRRVPLGLTTWEHLETYTNTSEVLGLSPAEYHWIRNQCKRIAILHSRELAMNGMHRKSWVCGVYGRALKRYLNFPGGPVPDWSCPAWTSIWRNCNRLSDNQTGYLLFRTILSAVEEATRDGLLILLSPQPAYIPSSATGAPESRTALESSNRGVRQLSGSSNAGFDVVGGTLIQRLRNRLHTERNTRQ